MALPVASVDFKGIYLSSHEFDTTDDTAFSEL